MSWTETGKVSMEEAQEISDIVEILQEEEIKAMQKSQ
jgi:hypothetical protein